MAKIDDMPLDTNAYLADTGHLTTFEHGAYFLILMTMWRAPDGWIPNDDQYLARATRMTGDKWKRIALTMRALLKIDGQKISQKRVLKTKAGIMAGAHGEDSSIASKSLKNNSSESDLPPEGKYSHETSLPTLLFEDSDPEKKVSGVRASKQRRAPRAMLSSDWQPSEHGVLYARAKGFSDQRIAEMGRGCLQYYRRRGDLIADREMMWENWVDREIKFAADRAARVGKNGRPTMADIAMGRDT